MVKILFVDDDENLLNALKRMLRKKIKEWNMAFVLSAQEALNHLENDRCQVVVSDYKMPGMNGLDLFVKIKEKYPEIKRIILSGQSEAEIFDKAKEIAHEYITKPCSPDELVSIIEKAAKEQ
ncbi:MAG: response regulator [Spirochaetes bacterium]|nr:response regulator [Spirochaetota bacterium]